MDVLEVSGEVAVIVRSDGDNLELRHPQDNTKRYTCKLNDFFSNNIAVDLNKISVLQLENCDISEIPTAFQSFNLKQLLLARNKLKEVPSCLYSGLKSLELLDLSHNLIKSFDIEPACSCTITTLKLNNNKIYNLPHWILTLRCPKLVELIYSRNFVVDLKASHQLNVEKLEICNSQLLDVDFTFFKKIKSLRYLDLGNDESERDENRFKDLDNLFVKPKWTRLEVLKLNNLMISILPLGLFRVSSLTELHLAHCALSWIPEDIQYLTDLKILNVSNNFICSLPPQLGSLKNLKIVRAPFNNISSVADFVSDLEVLDLYHNYLESLPSCMDRVELLDVEENCFDSTSCQVYETYRRKKNNLRQLLDYSRSDGPRELKEESSEEEIERFSVSSDDQSGYYKISDIESECWDEEKPQISIEKDPDVTPSDDEWDGKDVKKKEEPKVLPNWFHSDEDWIFSDAD